LIILRILNNLNTLTIAKEVDILNKFTYSNPNSIIDSITIVKSNKFQLFKKYNFDKAKILDAASKV